MQRRLLGVPLIVMGLLGVFPPRSAVDEGQSTHKPVARVFVLPHFFGQTSLMTYRTKVTAGELERFRKINPPWPAPTHSIKRCQIDVGRLMCEMLLVTLVSGVAVCVFPLKFHRQDGAAPEADD
jgi:hypothetical protein